MLQNLLKKYGDKFVSKWLILALDMTIILFSFWFAHLLRYTFNFVSIDYKLSHFAYIMGIRLLVHLYFNTYSGIIRHTSLEDIILIFKTVLLGTILTKAIEAVFVRPFLVDSSIHITTQILAIDFVLCLYLLIASRFSIKFLYGALTNQNIEGINVYIYGAGKIGSATKLALQNEKNQKYKIIGFIDDNPSMLKKRKEGVMVYSIEDVLNSNRIDDRTEVILAINDISNNQKKAVAERFLEHGIVLKTIPSINQLLNEDFSSDSLSSIKIEDLLDRPEIKLNINKIQKELSGKVIMVTGAAGSIGSEIVRQLIKFAPEKIILVDQAESALFELVFDLNQQFKDYLTQTILEVKVANVADYGRMKRIFHRHLPNIIFHAAAYKHVPLMEENPYEAVRVNVLGTKVIADLAKEYDANKFVMVSTDKAVNPTNVMGATKRLAEMYTQSMNHFGHTKYVITRFGNVLGSNGSVIPLFTKQIKAGGPITVTHPEITRYFMTIPEASQLVLEAGAMGVGSEVFVFDMGKPVKVFDLAKKMIQLSKVDPKQVKIQISGLRPGEKLYEELLTDNENTIPTHHEKIMRAKVNPIPFVEMELAMNDLKQALETASNLMLVKKIKQIVPEYISNNSEYEQLDLK
jgi:FlaA1/EpsC-like NDP-sugar epimerase